MNEPGGDLFAMQESQYDFPYHYLPHFSVGTPYRGRLLAWGFEYLCYLHHLQAIVEELAPRTILDVGCGEGRFLSLLQDAGRQCSGVDLAPRAIQFARAFLTSATFHEGTAADVDGKFDLVCAIEVLEHVPPDETAEFLQAIAARRAPAGHILLSVPSMAMPVNRKHYRHFDEALLRAELAVLQPDLEINRLEHVYRRAALLGVIEKLLVNRWYRLEVGSLNRGIWHYTWRRCRYGGPRDGRHLVAILGSAGPS